MTAAVYRESEAVKAFSLSLIILLTTALLLLFSFRDYKGKVRARDGFLLITLGCLLTAAFGAVPYALLIPSIDPIDAFFESVSNITTTGATTFADLDQLPRSLLFWRATQGWAGCLAVIYGRISIIPLMGEHWRTVANTNASGSLMIRLSSRLSQSSRMIYLLYIGLTILFAVILFLLGMNPFDALTVGMGAISTSGISNYDSSIAGFSSPCILIALSIMMLLSAVNYRIFFYRRKSSSVHRYGLEEFRFHLVLITIVAVLIFFSLEISHPDYDIDNAFLQALFYTASFTSTTGFTSSNYNVWPTFACMLLFLLMLIGSSSSSNGSGPKAVRVLVTLKMIRRSVHMRIYPNRLYELYLDRRNIPQRLVTNVINYVLLFIAILVVGSVITATNGFDMMTTVSSVLSCLCNVGKGFGGIGPGGSFAAFSDATKIVLSLIMIMGRIDLYAFFILLSPKYWDSNRP